MKYPPVHFDGNFCSPTGRRFLDMIRQSYPGPVRPDASIVLRWGQRTGFPIDKTIVIFDLGYFRR
ncbi:MAG: hypothetical protein KAI73_11515, partial [Rhodospirillaceae bacterium]|nr:hypothetical protein [Rhodospirillaceae bacterium]